MEPIYRQSFLISEGDADRFGRLLPSSLLRFVQVAAGEHCGLLHLSWQELQEKGLFWAILRHRLQITRWPQKGERILLETWPMPTTRTAYPRSVIAYDAAGQELLRSVSLWVLMDPNTRALVLPKKSGVDVPGILRGNELSLPGALMPGALSDSCCRTVRFTDLDLNGHMNNARYLDWVWDVLPSRFHENNTPRELTLYYHAEAREGETLELKWSLGMEGKLLVDALRENQRIFTASIEY